MMQNDVHNQLQRGDHLPHVSAWQLLVQINGG